MSSGELLIRTACEEDYYEIYQLNLKGLEYDYPIENTKQRLANILKDEKNIIFVAEKNECVVGYIHGENYDCTYSEPLLNILAIAVLPEYQHQGIGKKLIAALEEYAKLHHKAGIRLVSGENRINAHQFYLSQGYINRKMQKNFIKFFD